MEFIQDNSLRQTGRTTKQVIFALKYCKENNNAKIIYVVNRFNNLIYVLDLAQREAVYNKETKLSLMDRTNTTILFSNGSQFQVETIQSLKRLNNSNLFVCFDHQAEYELACIAAKQNDA